MNTEYKRDMNHNYLVFHGEEEVDTASYQVRMLVGNIIPSLLKCRIQGMDGKFVVYYDITSRQSVTAFYENRKLKQDDLKLIFGEFIRVMEDMAEYLINPGQLVIMPEYMFLEVEKREIYFCLMPGYQKDVREQFQALTEYILPKIDHADEEAVMIGYGVYRRAMEDSFHLEHIKEELYRVRKSESGKKDEPAASLRERSSFGKEKEGADTVAGDDLFADREVDFVRVEKGKVSDNEGKSQILKKAMGFGCGVLILAGVASAKMLGYLPGVSVEAILGGTLVCMGAGMLVYTIVQKRKEYKEKMGDRNTCNRDVYDRDVCNRSITRRNSRNNGKNKINRKNRDDECCRNGMISEEDLYSREWAFTENVSLGKEKGTENKTEDMDDNGTEHMKERREVQEKTVTEFRKNCGETVVLSLNMAAGPPSLVSREPGELATIYLKDELTVIGKLETAADAVIDLPTVSRVHAKIRRRDGEYYLTDLNSRNGTTVNGRILKAEEEYCLQNEDEVDFAQARYVFLQ